MDHVLFGLVRASTARVFMEDVLCGRRIVYHHLPHCINVSIKRAVRLAYPNSYVSLPPLASMQAHKVAKIGQTHALKEETDYIRRCEVLFYNLYHDVRCLAGNFPFSIQAHTRFSNQYRFITSLLDPVDFMWHAYVYYQKIQLPHAAGSIDEFLEHDIAKQIGSMYVRFYFGRFLPMIEVERTHLNEALRNMEKCTLVGDLAKPAEFYRLLMSIIRPSLIERLIPRRLENQASVTQSLDRSTLARIGALSEPNIEIYDYAQKYLMNRLNHAV